MTRVKNFLTPKWLKELEELKLTSSQASGRKPSSPGPRGQASNPRTSVPRSGNQGTSESVQALGNKQQG